MNTEIAEYIKNHIREYLPPEYQEAHITLEEVTKGNDRNSAVSLKRSLIGEQREVEPWVYGRKPWNV